MEISFVKLWERNNTVPIGPAKEIIPRDLEN